MTANPDSTEKRKYRRVRASTTRRLLAKRLLRFGAACDDSMVRPSRFFVRCAVTLLSLSIDACGARSNLADGESAGDAGAGNSGAGAGGSGGSAGKGGSLNGGTGGVSTAGTGGISNGGTGGPAAGGSGGSISTCPPETFWNPTSAACAPWTNCPPGTYVSAEGTATSDRLCTPCPAGQTSTRVNSEACHLIPIELAARDEHTCTLFSDGSVKCWGVNRRGGILGYGNTRDHVSDPASLGFVSVTASPGLTVQHLAAGPGITCALLSDGSLKCWGEGGYGQLGYGNTKNIGDDELPSSVGPVSVTTAAGVTVKSVAAGVLHTCALLSDGSVKCWGSGCCDGYSTSVGDNELPSSVGPLGMGAPPGLRVRELAANGLYTCALFESGTVKCWGHNDFGQLGYGNANAVASPASIGFVRISANPGVRVTQLVAGYEHVCVLLSDSSVKCWGHNNYGQLGYGNTANVGDNELPSSARPVAITTAPGVRVTALAAGAHHTCALLSNDTVKCWGLNSRGQLGYGNTQNIGDNELPSSVGPVSITGAPSVSVKTLVLGDYHSCALLSDSSLKCWGENALGQLGYAGTDSIGDNELPSSVGPVVLF